jgi:hypothetical protein
MKDKIALIIVFKKETNEAFAEDLLTKAGVHFHKGMDSSRGKLYFYKTGPKFIVTFDSEVQKNKFESTYKNVDAVYEIYQPNWDIRKD